MTEAVVDTTPIAEETAVTSVPTDDDASIKTEIMATPLPEPKEEEKADAFLAVLLSLWAKITGKVKEIDDNAGISTKLNEAKDATVKKAEEIDEQHQLSQKWCSITEALTDKFWKKEENEFVLVEKEESNTEKEESNTEKEESNTEKEEEQ